jgi:hypothetical protein
MILLPYDVRVNDDLPNHLHSQQGSTMLRAQKNQVSCMANTATATSACSACQLQWRSDVSQVRPGIHQ